MRLLALAALIAAAAPLHALEVTHNFGGRFGVAYTESAGAGRSHPLYEGRYTLGTVHRADNGLTFRFELDVVTGNVQDRGPDWPVTDRRRLTGSVGIGLQTD
jgi:hypothetical protein